MKTSVLALLVAVLASAACRNDSQSVTEPSTSAASGLFETFSGSLPVQGSSFYSFTVATAGTVRISLASLMANASGPASSSVVRLGFGVSSGTDCSITNSVETAAGLTAQLTAEVSPNVYCVNIADVGNLTGPMNFAIRVGQNVVPSSAGATNSTYTFGSFLAFRGSSAHTFSVSQAGMISLTLTSVFPPSVVGVGIGIPSASSPSCSLSRSVDTALGSTPQLTVAVDVGTYCAQVYDAGNLNAPGVAFSMTISHP